MVLLRLFVVVCVVWVVIGFVGASGAIFCLFSCVRREWIWGSLKYLCTFVVILGLILWIVVSSLSDAVRSFFIVIKWFVRILVICFLIRWILRVNRK